VAYAAELQEALDKAREAGESDPVVTRVPQHPAYALTL
jgi:hypothetical protein